ncbi:UNVERIFIED_CONTAM: hypothetical protein K2H54_063843, partial [Gekko kuhli]
MNLQSGKSFVGSSSLQGSSGKSPLMSPPLTPPPCDREKRATMNSTQVAYANWKKKGKRRNTVGSREQRFCDVQA